MAWLCASSSAANASVVSPRRSPSTSSRTRSLAGVRWSAGSEDQPCRQYGKSDERLEHQRTTELLRHDGALHRRAAEAAHGLGQGHTEPTHFGELLPLRAAETALRFGDGSARLEGVLLVQVTPHAVTQEALLFGKREVHDQGRR